MGICSALSPSAGLTRRVDPDVEDLLCSSSSCSSCSQSGGSPRTSRTVSGDHSPAVGICSALSPSAGLTRRVDPDVEDLLCSSSSCSSCSQSGGSPRTPRTVSGDHSPAVGICSGPFPWHHSSGSGKKGWIRAPLCCCLLARCAAHGQMADSSFPPERTRTVGNPQKLWEGTAKGLPKALWEGCKGRGTTGGETGWVQVGCFQMEQRCSSEESCTVAGQREQCQGPRKKSTVHLVP